MDEGVDPGSSEGQNLNDLQNYLVTFNKEIESNEGEGFQVGMVTPVTSGEETVFIEVQGEQSQESAIESEEQNQINDDNQITESLFTQQAVLTDGVEGVSDDVSTFVIAQSAEELTKQTIDAENIDNTVHIIKSGSVKGFETPVQLSSVHSHIAQLTGHGIQALPIGTIVSMPDVGSDLNAEHIVCGDEIKLQDVIHVTTSEDMIGPGEGQIVSVVDAEKLQLTDTESQSLTAQAAKLLIPADDDQTDSIASPLVSQNGEVDIIDGTNPVAVLASVAANTSNVVNHLHTVQVGQSELHTAQLVALQSSSDSSQPQLVAVQASEEGETDTLQIMNTAEAGQDQNSFVLNTGGGYQTVTIMPSANGQGSDMSYVLIVSNPDGEKEGGTKQIALDMSNVYDFKEDGQEIIEEIIEEDGTTKRVVKITPRKLIAGTGEFSTPLMCSYCNYTSPKRYLLTRHMKTHSEDRPHKCNICGRGFKTQASLQNHINTHTGTRPHSCKECDSAFTTSGELVRHMRYRHTFEKPHKCTECEYASVELSKLKRHIRSHTGERPYQCPHCTYASPDTYKLKRHLRIHTGEKPYECDVCHARFTQSNSLKAHKLIHTGNKPVYQCSACPTTCGRKTDLKIHFQKLHSSEKPLECKKCEKVFPDRYTYKLHIKTHEGEKCFKCDQCDYAALSQRHLESHFLTHTGEKPFECDSCEMTFRQKQLLKRHKNLYHTPDYEGPETKDKPHDCLECDRSFTHKGNLQRHLVAHDTDLQVKDGNDGQSTPSTEQLLQNSLLTEMREGKLGNSPKIVIVHPDGRVEEVTDRLQSLSQEKPGNEMLVMNISESSQVESCSGSEATIATVTPVSDSNVAMADTVPEDVVEAGLMEQISEAVETECVDGKAAEDSGKDDQTKEAGTQAAFESESESEEEEGEGDKMMGEETTQIEVLIPETSIDQSAQVIYAAEKMDSVSDELSSGAVIESHSGKTTLTIPISMLSNLGAVLDQNATDKGTTIVKMEVASPAKRARIHE